MNSSTLRFAVFSSLAFAPALAPAADLAGFDQGTARALETRQQFLSEISAESIQQLGQALSDEKDRIRFWAVKTLAEIPARAPGSSGEAVAHLRKALSDRTVSVRLAAAAALAELSDASGESALIQGLSGANPMDQRIALDALERVGGKASIPTLVATLTHPDPETSRKAFGTGRPLMDMLIRICPRITD